MARLLYSLLLYSMQPLIALRLLWRSYHQPEYRKNLAERYGFYRQQAQDTRKKYIWLHAVSEVG